MEIGSGFFNTANAHGPLFWWKDKLSLVEYEKTNSSWVKHVEIIRLVMARACV